MRDICAAPRSGRYLISSLQPSQCIQQQGRRFLPKSGPTQQLIYGDAFQVGQLLDASGPERLLNRRLYIANKPERFNARRIFAQHRRTTIIVLHAAANSSDAFGREAELLPNSMERSPFSTSLCNGAFAFRGRLFQFQLCLGLEVSGSSSPLELPEHSREVVLGYHRGAAYISKSSLDNKTAWTLKSASQRCVFRQRSIERTIGGGVRKFHRRPKVF